MLGFDCALYRPFKLTWKRRSNLFAYATSLDTVFLSYFIPAVNKLNLRDGPRSEIQKDELANFA